MIPKAASPAQSASLLIESQNPFVAIPQPARVAVILYFVGWRVFPLTGELAAAMSGISVGHILAVSCQILVQCLLLYPFLRDRFAGSMIGWAHPFILPTMIGIGVTVLRSPQHLLAPLAFFYPDQTFSHSLLGHLPMESMRYAQLKLNSITLMSIAATYIGFSLFRFVNTPTWKLPAMSAYRLPLVAIACAAVTFFFLQQQGGIINHMTSLAGGRFRMRELVGHYLIVSNFLPYLLIFWYLHKPRVLRTPVFLLAFLSACVIQFIVTGSRSGLFIPFAMLLVAWMLISHRFPAIRAASIGLIAFVVLGALGQVRQSGYQGEASFSALFDRSIMEQLEATQSMLEQRGARGSVNLAVVALVPDDVNYLRGRSYVSAAMFWMPRAIWRGKPRGIGAHAAALIFGGHADMEGYSGAGYPVSAPAEAYWNFSWPGVMLVFLLFGVLTRFIADWRQNSPNSPIAAMVLVLATFQFASPSTVSMVSFLHNIVLLAGTVAFARLAPNRG